MGRLKISCSTISRRSLIAEHYGNGSAGLISVTLTFSLLPTSVARDRGWKRTCDDCKRTTRSCRSRRNKPWRKHLAKQTEEQDDSEDEEDDEGSKGKLRVHATASLRSPLLQQQTKVAASAKQSDGISRLPITVASRWLHAAVHCYLRVSVNKEIEELRQALRTAQKEAAKQLQALEDGHLDGAMVKLQLCIQVQGYVGACW